MYVHAHPVHTETHTLHALEYPHVKHSQGQ